MNTFSATFRKIQSRQKVSSKVRNALKLKANRKICSRNIASSSDDEGNVGFLTSDRPTTSGADVEVQAPDWDMSSIDSDGSLDSLSTLDSLEDEHKEIEGPPLYEACKITRQESTRGFLKLINKHNLTKTASNDFVKFLHSHLPLGVSYPNSYYQLRKEVEIPNNWSTKVFFCRACSEEVNNNFKCPKCKTVFNPKLLREAGDYFVQLDIRAQFLSLLENTVVQKNVIENLSKKKDMDNSYSGFSSGAGVLALSKLPLDLTCTYNFDGIPIFESSKKSLWPVLITINELPFYLRKTFIIVGGLWFGEEKPDTTLFLPRIVEAMNQLSQTPIVWNSIQYGLISSHVYFILCVADAVARCMLQGHIQFNGKYGCPWCRNPGRSISKGAGHCKIFPPSATGYKLRDNLKYIQNAKAGKFVKGQKFLSPLVNLVNFDMVNGFSVDYMHCVFLGVVRSHTVKWITEVGAPYYIGRKLNQIDSNLLRFKVPYEIVRTCRSIQARKYWKASEWRTWLFICPVVLAEILPNEYLHHFGLLSRAIYLLSKTNVTVANLEEAQGHIDQFLHDGGNLYGEEFYSFNVHQLEHLVSTVHYWGPLWNSSAFQFESYNGKLINMVSSSNGVVCQIVDKFVTGLVLNHVMSNISHDKREFGLCMEKTVLEMDLFFKNYLPKNSTIVNINSSRKAWIHFHKFCTNASTKRCNNLVVLNGNELAECKRFYKISYVGDGIAEELYLVEVDAFKVQSELHDHIHLCKSNRKGKKKFINMVEIKKQKPYHAKFDDVLYFIEIPNLFEVD